MRIGPGEFAVVLVVLLLILFLTRGKNLVKKVKNKKDPKQINSSSNNKAVSSSSKSQSSSKEDDSYKQTLKYAGVAFACIGVLFILATQLVDQKFAIYLYIAGGLFVGIGLLGLIMLLLINKK